MKLVLFFITFAAGLTLITDTSLTIWHPGVIASILITVSLILLICIIKQFFEGHYLNVKKDADQKNNANEQIIANIQTLHTGLETLGEKLAAVTTSVDGLNKPLSNLSSQITELSSQETASKESLETGVTGLNGVLNSLLETTSTGNEKLTSGLETLGEKLDSVKESVDGMNLNVEQSNNGIASAINDQKEALAALQNIDFSGINNISQVIQKLDDSLKSIKSLSNIDTKISDVVLSINQSINNTTNKALRREDIEASVTQITSKLGDIKKTLQNLSDNDDRIDVESLTDVLSSKIENIIHSGAIHQTEKDLIKKIESLYGK